jgi:hypothetical protein
MKATGTGGKSETKYELKPQAYPDRPVADRCWLYVPENVTKQWIAAGLRPAA